MAKSSKSTNHADVKKNVDKLLQTVFHGNGTPSILNQITKIEGRINTLEASQENRFNSLQNEMDLKFDNITEVVTEKFKNLSSLIESEFSERKTNSSNTWSFRTAVTTGLIASTTSIVVVLLTEFLKIFR